MSGSRRAKATTQGLCTCDMSCENSPIFQDKEGELSVGRLQPRLGQHREEGEGMLLTALRLKVCFIIQSGCGQCFILTQDKGT